MAKKGKLPAIPPNDYEGSIADWEIALIGRGLMEHGDWYGDIWLTREIYREILEECEA